MCWLYALPCHPKPNGLNSWSVCGSQPSLFTISMFVHLGSKLTWSSWSPIISKTFVNYILYKRSTRNRYVDIPVVPHANHSTHLPQLGSAPFLWCPWYNNSNYFLMSYFKIVFSVLKQFWWRNTLRKEEESGYTPLVSKWALQVHLILCVKCLTLANRTDEGQFVKQSR